MAKPKLALIPAAQGSKFYSVLPSSGVGDFDFTRSGSATRINSQGLIETVGNGVSRLNYPLIDGKVVGCPHHLLEPERRNLVTYSEDFSQISWQKQSSGTGSVPIVTPNYAISPDGTLNADRVIFDVNGGTTGSDFSQLKDAITSDIGDVTNSIWIKSNTTSNYNMSFIDPNSTFTSIVVTTEWKRFDVTSTTTTTSSSFRLRLRGSESTSDFADVSLWGAQVEEGYLTSYIPTNGSTATRFEETANGSGDADTFNDSEGVLMAEFKGLSSSDTSNRRLGITKNGTYEGLRLQMGNGTIGATLYDGTTNQYSKSVNIDNSIFHKVALKYKSNDFAIYIDGFEYESQSNGSTFVEGTLDDISFDYVGGNPFYGNAKQIQYFDSALTDSELEQLTSWTSFSDMANGQLYSIQ